MADSLQPSTLASGIFLRELISEDILAEDVTFDPHSTPAEVVRPTYQKFADHLTARYILEEQLENSSKTAIRKSLKDPARLGWYFKDKETALANINIIQALLIEFPTRIGNKGEIFDYLEWDAIPIRICETFLEGLYWREPNSINDKTVHWLNRFLAHDDLRESALNVLVALGVKPKHPFQADRLDAYLRKLSLVDRDLFWSEYLRSSLERGTPIRLLIWAEHSAKTQPSPDFASVYISTLQWFLTSTQRSFRDRATHALFQLGLANPELLFEHTLASLSINDPYVWTRMLAASYGACMALWASPKARRFQQHIFPAFATHLYRFIFRRGAKYGTTHILARDYALRTIQLALKLRPRLLTSSQRKQIIPPFMHGGIRNWQERDDSDKEKYRSGDSPLGMDFRNYTLGRLIRNRSAYDDQHLEYEPVRRQILWRIYDLGYSLEKFSSIDQNIARASWHHGRGEGPQVAESSISSNLKYF